ncbi:MAG: hypothetical protein NXY57DRAFT_1044419 [Lentinula lateritia]|nr:MAG: hypothetical protein NXY57DRAFT_1044419 [Lentinula lateritia]
MTLLPKDGLDKFKGWVHRQMQPFPQILKALDVSKREGREQAAAKREFVTRLSLNPNSVHCCEWVEKRSKDITTYKKLKYDILKQESAAFQDDKGKFVSVAMRGLCSDPNIVNWADSRVQKNVETEKNIRKENAGCIVIAGWSGGVRSKPGFNWVKNLTKKIPDAEKRNLRYEAASRTTFTQFNRRGRQLRESQMVLS